MRFTEMTSLTQVATIVFVLVLGAPSDFVCRCIKPEVKDAYDKAKIVFVGEVVEVVPPRSSDPDARFVNAAHTIKFKVETAWKEQFWTEANVLVRIDRCFSLRRLPQKGEKYLVYAEPVYWVDASSTEVMTNSCTRTALLSDLSVDGFFYRDQAANDIRALNSLMFVTRSKPIFNPMRLNFVPNN